MRRFFLIAVILLLAILLLYPLAIAAVALQSPVPSTVGLVDVIARCRYPNNCVSSVQGEAEAARILPFFYTGNLTEAQAALQTTLQEQPGVQIVYEEDGYIHAEHRSPVLRFIDDVEFKFDESTQQITVRSAARLGTEDGGANRQLIEAIRQAFNNRLP